MKTQYLQKIDEVVENTSKRIASLTELDSVERLNFLRFKSALNFIHPDINVTTDVYKTYLLNRELSNLEVDYLHLLEKNGFSEMLGNPDFSRERTIYCSYHMGSYLSIGYYLIKNNINFTIVIGADDFDNKKEMFMNSYYNILGEVEGSTSKMDIINGQNKNSIISMIKKVKSGESLLFYIDGSKGLKEFSHEDDNLVEITLLKSKLFSRKGISFLSHYLKIPIVPVISYRANHDEIKVKFLDAIEPFGERQEYCSVATQTIWDNFSEIFLKYPLQWESIYFMHQFKAPVPLLRPKYLKASEIYTFNANRYDFYINENNKVIFDNTRGKSIRLSNGYIDFLYKIHANEISLEGNEVKEIIKNEESINALIDNEFLVSNTK
ncbi:hypothetical protein [uncultured Tenacibaculum sp.]|uniref:hypothetical protein n=1 Tax=uncultured Tenacibaculum sp. TaxID=174713 RepID=UPI002624B172|nr:hypothetical protein [uncultured Tenacibaculum sp.]